MDKDIEKILNMVNNMASEPRRSECVDPLEAYLIKVFGKRNYTHDHIIKTIKRFMDNDDILEIICNQVPEMQQEEAAKVVMVVAYQLVSILTGFATIDEILEMHKKKDK